MSGTALIPALSPADFKALEIFHPFAFAKTVGAITGNQRFAHYTSADTALKAIKNREVWMRKASCMNDFMEIEYGFGCLKNSTDAHQKDLERIFDGMFPGFFKKLVELFNGWLPTFRNDTYIACLSEHDASEDTFGRLSMWRAYGGSTGVAMILKGTPFLKPNDALKAYTSPVAYLDTNSFDSEFMRVLKGIEANADFVKNLGESNVLGRMFEVFRAAMLCTKHPGFHEEREWRLIYTPTYRSSKHIKSDIESVAGTPQPVCKIPLADIPSEGLVDIEIPAIVDRVIIGPTQYPLVVREAFVTVLKAAGMSDAANRVIVSDIPLRN